MSTLEEILAMIIWSCDGNFLESYKRLENFGSQFFFCAGFEKQNKTCISIFQSENDRQTSLAHGILTC